MDTRPQLERTSRRALARCYLLIVGCAIVGGVTAGVGALHLTKPKGSPA